MSDAARTIAGARALVVDAHGAPIGSEADALELISAAYDAEAELVFIPIGRLRTDFLDLRTRVAGLFVQKLVNYGHRIVFVGDILHDVAASTSLGDFVRECNRGTSIWFVPDLTVLEARLTAAV